jgi:hypothetical protein
VLKSDIFRNRCYLIIEYQNRDFMGCLLLDDPVFCSEIYALLTSCVRCSIKEIGDTDVSYTL